jgi:hypothetical protein
MSDDKQKFKNKKFSLRLPSSPNIKLGSFGSFKLPTFGKITNPLPSGLYLGGGKLIVISLSTVILGFLASLFLLMSKGEQEITWPMAGAEYTAPSMIGVKVVDAETPERASQTLKINLPGGLRLDNITLTNISLGQTSLTTALQIVGTSAAYILIDDLIIKNSEFPTMDFANAEFYTITATTGVQTAGHTFEQTATSTIADITVGSDRGVATYVAEDMIVDRIIITVAAGATSDVVIDTLTIDNVRTWIGAFDLDYVKAGTLLLENIKVGDDGNIDTADMVINSTVSYNNMADGVVDAPINIK